MLILGDVYVNGACGLFVIYTGQVSSYITKRNKKSLFILCGYP